MSYTVNELIEKLKEYDGELKIHVCEYHNPDQETDWVQVNELFDKSGKPAGLWSHDKPY